MTHEQIRQALATGCSEEELKEMRCPICGSEVLFYVHPNRRTCFIRCKQDSSHMAMHEENLSSPDWWAKYVVRGGWLS
jgi:DNA-directed RNA polymerase subunit RPC12/RpoP